MAELAPQQSELIGREEELDRLNQVLDAAISGNGSMLLVSGEAGIGKTRLVTELIKESDAQLINCRCLAENLEPLLPVKTAFREAGLRHLISGDPPPLVVSAYLINESGILIAQAEREESGLDPEIFAAMLQAVGDFVRDSLSMMDKKGGAGLNSLGYGDYTILIQSSGRMSIAAVIEGVNSEFLIEDMKRMLEDIGVEFEDWSGDVSEAADVKRKLGWFINSGKYDGKFLVDDPKLKQENLFDNVLLGLQRQSSEKPTIFFCDDLQWADPTTLNLLHYLTRNIRKNRIQIFGTYRPEDMIESSDGRAHPLEITMQNMSREDLLDKIELKRLDRQGTEALINGTLGKINFESGFFDRIFKGTEGTPFFVLEVVKLLVESGAIARDDDGAWTLVTEMEKLDIPSKIYDVVKRRLDRLLKGQKEILECASVVGEEFESEVVGNIAGLDKLLLLKNLSEIEKTHKLVRYLEGKYRFDHAKIREVLYNGIGEELRKEYHRIAGDTIAEFNKDDPNEIVNVLAYHYYEAGDERAGECLVKAGDAAKERYANEEAVRLYRNALKVLKDDGSLRNTYENLGDVYFLAGEYTATIETYNSALKMEEDNKKKMNIHKKIASVYANKGDFQESKEVCDRGLELLKDEECIERAQLLESQGWAYVRMGDYENAGELLVKSLGIAESLQDKKAIAKAHHTIGSMNLMKGDFNDALEHLEMALKIREEIDDAGGQSASLNNIGVVYWNKGEVDKAREYYEQSLEIDEKIGNKWGISTAFNNIGLVHSEKGESDKALEYYEKTVEIDEKIGDKSGIASAFNNIGIIYSRKGELDKALEYYKQSLELRENIGDKTGIAHSHINIGNMYHSKGERDKAVEHYKKSHEIGIEIGDKWLLGHVYFSLAESILELGEIESAFEYAQKGLELSVKTDAKREQGMSHKVLGMIYREKGEWEKSIESFEKAKVILEEIRDKNALTRVFYEYGLMWKAKAEPDKAKDNLEKALALAREMGMRLWVGKCKTVLESL